MEASHRGVGVADAAVASALREYEHEMAPAGRAEFAEYLQVTGQTAADVRFKLTTKLAAHAISKLLANGERPIDDREVTAYYAAHLQRFTVPETRAITIVEVPKQPEAERAKHEIQSGRPIDSLKPFYERLRRYAHAGEARWRMIERAIFSAPLHVVRGPLRLVARWSVFEVTAITPATTRSLAHVRGAIRALLEAGRRGRARNVFLSAWRSKWKALTDCPGGLVVAQCRQYGGSSSGLEQLPFALS